MRRLLTRFRVKKMWRAIQAGRGGEEARPCRSCAHKPPHHYVWCEFYESDAALFI